MTGYVPSEFMWQVLPIMVGVVMGGLVLMVVHWWLSLLGTLFAIDEGAFGAAAGLTIGAVLLLVALWFTADAGLRTYLVTSRQAKRAAVRACVDTPKGPQYTTAGGVTYTVLDPETRCPPKGETP
jgi:hypothetical protein